MKKRRKTGRRLLLVLLCLAVALPGAFGVRWLIQVLTTTAGDYTFAVLDDGSAEIKASRAGSRFAESDAALFEIRSRKRNNCAGRSRDRSPCRHFAGRQIERVKTGF